MLETVLSSLAAADMVGNNAQVISGTNFTTGFFQVTSVSVGVSITFSTNSSGTSICTGVGASGVINIGGALATMSKAGPASAINHTIYLKGTLTTSAIQVISKASDFNTPYTINGYSTARDDGTRATWTTATNNISLIDISSACNVQFKNINFTNTAGTKGTGQNGCAIIPISANAGTVLISQCSFSGFTVAISADWQNVSFAVNYFNLDNVEITNSASHGMISTCGIFASGCFFHGNTGDGYRMIESTNTNAGTSPPQFAFCVFHSNGGNGFTDTHNQITTNTPFAGSFGASFINCVFSNNTGDGVNGPANHTIPFMVWNCIFYNNGGWGWNSSTANVIPNCIPRCNAFGSNSSGARQNFPTGPGDVSLTASPFTNVSTPDFSLNSTSGGGPNCKAAGFGAFVFGTGHIDIGAVQSAGSAASGALTLQATDVLGIDG